VACVRGDYSFDDGWMGASSIVAGECSMWCWGETHRRQSLRSPAV